MSRGGLGFMVEGSTHPRQEVYERDVLVEVDGDRLELAHETIIAVSDPTLVEHELRVRAAHLGSPRPAPGLVVLVSKDDEAFEVPRTDGLIDQALLGTRRHPVVEPHTQALEPCDLSQRVNAVLRCHLEVALIGVAPAEMIDEEIAELTAIDQPK
ncbi:hypothetical protein [Microbacterium sp. 67-17]|uniref:hypothetical protein n=1 Tax=Microbacterium sp. 67-17 TaxID=1895782 RepID=UPI0025F79480|nr:hypothetical protein [Microbacterium sp. 67-17]